MNLTRRLTIGARNREAQKKDKGFLSVKGDFARVRYRHSCLEQLIERRTEAFEDSSKLAPSMGWSLSFNTAFLWQEQPQPAQVLLS